MKGDDSLGNPLRISAADGTELAAARFEPPARPAKAVLIVPAMGVAQSYYAPFAAWLARHGFAVATFDFRGIGRSRPASLRGYRADLCDWAQLDCAAALEELRRAHPGAPLVWLGHSLGGQIYPFAGAAGKVERMITVATGSGYWRENTPHLRRYSWWLWFVVVPLALRLCGYFPGRRLRKIGDLPHGVMAQWRRWCLHREYAVGVERGARELYAAVRTPIFSLSFTDDEYMSEQNVASIHGFYSGAPRTMKRVAPADVGERAIGHFGCFRPRCEESLWRPVLLPVLAGTTDCATGR